MKVFITGIAGFLGSHLADYWLNQGAEVRGCDNLSGGSYENISTDVKFFKRDITQTNLMHITPGANIFANDSFYHLMIGCDIVYHCAAAPYEGVSVFSPAYISDNIFSGSINVFTAAIKAGVKRIVYCSSMARYGKLKPPFRECYVPHPVDPYGIAKEAAERTLDVLSKVHGIEYSIAVPHNIYGPRQKYDDPYRNVAAIMVNRMLQGKQPIIYGDGQQKRCFSYIDDCIACLAKMGTYEAVVGKTINIGPDRGEITINQLGRLLSSIIGLKFDPIYMPDRPQEVKIAHCSSEQARLLLDYETKTSTENGMELLVNWIKEKGPKPFEYDHVPLEIISDKTPLTWSQQLI